MTTREFRKSITDTVRSVMDKNQFYYNHIDISYRKEIVAIGDIGNSDDLGFFQGEAATELINEGQKLADKFKINIKTAMVYLLDSAGLFQK